MPQSHIGTSWVLLSGTGLAVGRAEGSPLGTIIFAQVANGMMLPVVAVFLVVVMNRKSLLGVHANRAPANLAGLAVVVVTGALGAWRIVQAVERLLE